MKNMHNCIRKKILATLLVCGLMAGILPFQKTSAQQNTARIAGYGLSNPVVDSSKVTTWDCIYFGHYWQNDTNGDGLVNKDDDKEPIKWRVLSVTDDNVFLLSDQNLDQQVYKTLSDKTGVTWETSTIRSWLNGYGAESNLCGEDFTNDNFLSAAFNASEQAAIVDTKVAVNDNTMVYPDNGNDTMDKVYLLSASEIMSSSYGFESTWNNTKTRESQNTAYISSGGGNWWLRTIVSGEKVCYIDASGRLWRSSEAASASDLNYVVRPALHLKLSALADSSNLVWSYAGKLTSNGEVIDAELPGPEEPTESPVPTASPVPSTSPAPTESPVPTASPVPTESPVPSVSPAPTESPVPTASPVPSTSPVPTESPVPSVSPVPAESPVPSVSPAPTESPVPSTSPVPTESPVPSVSPVPAESLVPTMSPVPTESLVPTASPAPIKISKITVTGKITKLAKGKTAKLKSIVEPANAANKNVVWSSSNPKVAAVASNGTVTAKAIGKAVITATAADGSGIIGSYKIKVVKHAVKKIIIKAKKKNVAAGKKVKITATIKTSGKKANKTLEWKTSNQNYATVNSQGVVTTKKAGKGKTVKITAMATDGTGKKDIVKIKIK